MTVVSWPLILAFERVREAARGAEDRKILGVHTRPRGNPAERRRVEERAPLDHLPSRFGEGGDAELRAERERAAVPRRRRAAAVLFPEPQPRKDGAPPRVSEQPATARRTRDEGRLGPP